MAKVQVLDFYAEWCGPCKAMEPAIESLMTEYNVEGSDVEIKKVNVDNEHELTQKYNIKGIPTLIFLKDGEEAHRDLFSRVYGNMPLDQALNQYVTGNKNSDLDINMGSQGQKITSYKNAVIEAAKSPTTTASVRRPTGLNSYSVALNNKANSQMPMTNINNINQTNASSTPPAVKPSSAYDVQIATLLLGLAT